MAKKLRVKEVIVVFTNENFRMYTPQDFEDVFKLEGAKKKMNTVVGKMFPKPKWQQEPKS